jgi:cytochrome d ubiquinol oxidase subunit II
MPIMLMLAALIFRGIAFEFRFKSGQYRYIWDTSFCLGSTLAAFMQGVILGTFVLGYKLDSTGMVSSSYHWLTPFSLMTGIAVVNGYALLGSTWLVAKTLGELQLFMRRTAFWLLLGVALFMLVVSVWTPLNQTEIMQRWFSLPNLFYLAPLPLTAGLVFLYTAYSIRKGDEYLPFYLAIILFILAYAGFCISLWPYVVPRVYTLWQAAAPVSTQQFILVGAAILMPVLLGYTAYAYYVFRGKVVKADLHY